MDSGGARDNERKRKGRAERECMKRRKAREESAPTCCKIRYLHEQGMWYVFKEETYQQGHPPHVKS